MGKFITRLLVVAALIVGGFYAVKLGLTYRFAVQTKECTPETDQLALKNEHATEADQLRIAARTFVCVANKQNFVDRMFFDARKFFDSPEKWPFPIDEYKRELKSS